jgi:Flp pilus assembly protein TadD
MPGCSRSLSNNINATGSTIPLIWTALMLPVRARFARFSITWFFLIAVPALLGQSATSVRETDAACADCHQKIFRGYLKTPMANASGLAAQRAIAGSLHHPNSGVDYRVTVDSDGPHLSYHLPQNPPMEGSVKLDYFLGSGHLGTTYIYEVDRFLFESPIAYYRELDAYEMKPGLEKSSSMPAGLALNDACLRCHMSAVQPPDAGTDNRYSGLPFLHTGITCESCHGNTQKHVATRGKSPLLNLVHLSPEKRDSICVLCHLEGDTNVARRDRSILDFQPGDDITAYLEYFAYAGANTTTRAVSEIEQFNTSKCKRASGAEMSCVTCHDPHDSPNAAERISYFRARCLACHTPATFATHHPENPDCASCHMPKTGSQNIAHVAWTDHRLLRNPASAGQTAEPGATLQPILSDDHNQRDLGLAYYNLVVKGKTAETDRAIEMLSAADVSGPKDIAVLRALGVLSEMARKDSAAEQYYRAILKIEPANLTAATNLGVLRAKAGDLSQAVALWQPVYRNNEDVVGLGANLATAQCLLGEKLQAEETLKRVLIYSPDLRALRSRLTAMQSGQQPCPAR